MLRKWIATVRPHRSPAVRVVCVPDAGGSASIFSGWSERLSIAEVGVVQLPGRWSRWREPMLDAVADAAEGTADAIAALPPYPTVLVGHGVGALIAFEASRRLRDRSWPQLALVASGCRAPSLSRAPASIPSDEVLAEIRRCHQTQDPMIADPEVLQLFERWLRADCSMAQRYLYDPAAPLECPIIACGGASDPYVPRLDLEPWGQETRSRFTVRTFSGGHSYLLQERTAVTTLIASHLSVLLGAMFRRNSAG